jgi:hypothetical protein
MIRAGFLSGSLSLLFLVNIGMAAGPPAISSESRLAYERQIAQAREQIQKRAATEAQDRAARIDARKRAAGRLVPAKQNPRSSKSSRSPAPIGRNEVLLIDPPPK